MESKSSFGYDGIPIGVLKDNIDYLDVPLSNFFNNCMAQGIFPEQLHTYKKGMKNDPKNYRPISLLPVISKVFEKIIKDRLVSHLNLYNIISEFQFGYQTGIGTVVAIDSLLNDIVVNLNNRNKVVGLFLDLSSAFDTVDHNILIAKLEHYGVRGNELKLITSYLTNRKQFVEIKSVVDGREVVAKSNIVDTKRGVPQGSILGPIFFIIFLNDLIKYMKNSMPEINLAVYADDTNAIMPSNNIRDLESKVHRALETFNKWFSTNKLNVNIKKTNAILFKSTANNHESISICSEGENVNFVSSLKFLGIYIDQYLNWKTELESIENYVSSACYAIRSLRDEVSIRQLKTVYFALVESKLRYSIKFWGNSYSYNINRAFTIQKRAIRTMVRIPQWESCKDHFLKLQILTLPSLYILLILTDVVKNPLKYETIDQRKHRMLTRRKDIEVPFTPKLEIAKHCSRYQTVKLYNSLPVELKCLENPMKFITELKKLLLEGCFYSIEAFNVKTNLIKEI